MEWNAGNHGNKKVTNCLRHGTACHIKLVYSWKNIPRWCTMGLTYLSVTLQWFCNDATQQFRNSAAALLYTRVNSKHHFIQKHAVVQISHSVLYHPQVVSVVWQWLKMCLQITWMNEYLNNTCICIMHVIQNYCTVWYSGDQASLQAEFPNAVHSCSWQVTVTASFTT